MLAGAVVSAEEVLGRWAPSSFGDRLTGLSAVARARNLADADQVRLLAGIAADLGPLVEEPSRWDLERASRLGEVATALGLSHGAAQARIAQAASIAARPQLWDALASGQVDGGRVRLVDDACTALTALGADQAAVNELERRAVTALTGPTARAMTWSRLKARLRAWTHALAPAPAQDGEVTAAADRDVRFGAHGHHDALPGVVPGEVLVMDGPGTAGYDVLVLFARIDAEARALAAAGDTRTLAQLRFDVLASLAHTPTTASTASPVEVELQVLIPLESTDGPTDGPTRQDAGTVRAPGEVRGLACGRAGTPLVVPPAVLTAALAGRGPFGANACLRRVLTDPVTGVPVHVEDRSYPFPTAVRRATTLLHPTCTAPTCDRPTTTCQLDHAIPYATGGPSCTCNAHPLCALHHQLKTHAGWTPVLHPDGAVTWTTPTTTSTTTTAPAPIGPRWRPPPAPPPRPREPDPDDEPPF